MTTQSYNGYAYNRLPPPQKMTRVIKISALVPEKKKRIKKYRKAVRCYLATSKGNKMFVTDIET